MALAVSSEARYFASSGSREFSALAGSWPAAETVPGKAGLRVLRGRRREAVRANPGAGPARVARRLVRAET